MQNLIIPLNCNYSQENLFMKFHNCNIFQDSTLAIKDMSDCQALLALQMNPNGDNKKTLQRKLVSGLLWDFLYQERLHRGTLDIFLESKIHSCFATMKLQLLVSVPVCVPLGCKPCTIIGAPQLLII